VAALVVVLTGTAVSCERPEYDKPSGVVVPVTAAAIRVAGDGTVSIVTEVELPDPPRPGADALERVEISIRGSGGPEYLRAVYNASSLSVNPVVEFGLYPVGEVAEPGFDDAVGDGHDADTLWGAIHRDTEASRTGTSLTIRWVVSLLDVPPGDFEVFAKAVPGRQRDREWTRGGSFTLRPEALEDAGIHRDALAAMLEAGVVPIGDARFAVDDLWALYVSLLGTPDEMRATADHAGEPSFFRFLTLVAERGTEPAAGTEAGIAAMPDVDLASAALDPDPWIAAPALWLARKRQALIGEAALVERIEGWDAVAVDQALLHLADGRGEWAVALFEGSVSADELAPRIWTGLREQCILEILLADDPVGDGSVRLQRPTKAGMQITVGGEPAYGWDGESPLRVEPGSYRVSYLLGDPAVTAGPVSVECRPGAAARVVLWRWAGT